jgi:hypothetical protein
VDDPFNLQRFVDAQAPVYEQVLDELRAGRKTTHWIWFVFPQAKGLGRSALSERYAIGSLDEAAPISPIRCSVRGSGTAWGWSRDTKTSGTRTSSARWTR